MRQFHYSILSRSILLTGSIAILGACASPPDAPSGAGAANDIKQRPVQSAQAALQRGRVVDSVTGLPVASAQVRVIGTFVNTTTDADGRFALRAPDGFSRFEVESDGYVAGSGRLAGDAVRLWPAVDDPERDRRVLEQREIARVAHDNDPLDDPDLTDRARAILAARRTGHHDADPLAPEQVLKNGGVEVPATIRLYRRGNENNSCTGRVDVIPLEEYTRGVVPHEWISSWHAESLKAGAVAARSYAAGWIARGGKYDCADLDDTTRSQVYRDDRNAAGDAAVAATTGEVIVRDGGLVTTEYSAENGDPTEFGVDEPLCTGRERFGHGRGMCQWGTQRWATQRGQTYDWMVAHYFPGASVGCGAEPTADLHLRQRINRIDVEDCIDPEGTYNCADFVRQGWSTDIFDLWVGRRFELAIEVTNNGAAASPGGANNTVIHVQLPSALQATSVDIDGAGMPPSSGEAGGLLVIAVPAIAAGEMRRIGLSLRGDRTSIGGGAPAPIRSWVRRIEGLYDKPDWAGAPGVNEGQGFNGGDLRVLAEFDVFTPDRFSFNSADAAMAEGWQGVGGEALQVADGALRVPAAGVVSAFTHIDADTHGSVRIDDIAGRLYWRAAGQPFANAQSVRVDGSAELSGEPGWAGEIVQLQFEPDAAGTMGALLFGPAGTTPEPDPEPTPQPTAEPDPNPAPQPTFEPDPQPAPRPDPEPTANPDPRPEPQPGPRPEPEPRPDAGTPGVSGVRGTSTAGCRAAMGGSDAPSGWWFLVLGALALRRRR